MDSLQVPLGPLNIVMLGASGKNITWPIHGPTSTESTATAYLIVVFADEAYGGFPGKARHYILVPWQTIDCQQDAACIAATDVWNLRAVSIA